MLYTHTHNDKINTQGRGCLVCLTRSTTSHFDCAWIYGNEKEIGRAFQRAFAEGKVKREDLFVTGKVRLDPDTHTFLNNTAHTTCVCSP